MSSVDARREHGFIDKKRLNDFLSKEVINRKSKAVGMKPKEYVKLSSLLNKK